MSDIPLTVVLKADGSGLTGTVRVSERELRRMQRAMDETGKSGEKLGKGGEAAAKGVRKTGTDAQATAKELDKTKVSADRLDKAFKSVRRTAAGVFAGIGIAMTIRATVRDIATFEQSMSRVQAISRASAAEMQQLTAMARELGATTRFSAAEAAEGMAFLSMAGFNAQQTIAAMPAVLNLATAAQLDLGRAADITSNIMSAFGLRAEETGRIADALASIAASANTDISQMGEAMRFAGPVARALKIDMEDTAAAIGVLSNAGIQGGAAGTGLRRVLSSLAKPSREARDTLEGLGLSMRDLDPATNSLTDIVRRLAAANIDATDAFTIFGDRGAAAILALTSQVPDLERLTGTVRESAGEAQRMSDTMNDTLMGDWLALKSAIAELMLVTGDEGFLGVLRSVTQELATLARMLSGKIPRDDEASVAGFLYWIVESGRERLGSFRDELRATEAEIESLQARRTALQASNQILQAVPGGMRLNYNAEIDALGERIAQLSTRAHQLRDSMHQSAAATDELGDAAANAAPPVAELGEGTGQMSRETTDFLAKLKEQLDTLGLNEAELMEYAAAQVIAADETGKAAGQITALVQQIHAKRAALDAAKAADEAATLRTQELSRSISQAASAEATLARMERQSAARRGSQNARAAVAYSNALASIAAAESALLALGPMSAQDLDRLNKLRADAREELEGNSEAALELESILGRFDDIGMSGLVRDINLVRDALDEATDPAQIERMERALVQMNAQLAIGTLEGYKSALGAVQAFTKEGSKGFRAMEAGMAALSIVQDLIALKAAVSAVLTQGQGDPYSAWARMAAMAAAVAPFLASIGQTLAGFGGGGGFSSTAEQRQETQGTGTVLGDATAKSESIARAAQITADATSQLVGINRGMLRALQNLEAGIAGATTSLARGAGSADFSALPNTSFGPGGLLGGLLGGLSGAGLIGGLFGGGIVGALLGRLLGGSSEITDQGIVIMGGALSQMIEDIAVGAYQEVKYRRWRFGSTRTREDIQRVSGEFERQFQLILESITDTVREGALALGLLPDEIEAALAAFRVEEIRISLMDLSPEEQQAEIAAVFGAIFDNLAGHVVPFISQFQRVGEGLGETLVRVATGVQVTQEAVRMLGFALDETDPERFAQISEGLIEMAGGLDEFIAGMQSFVEKFAPDEHRFEVAQDAMTRAFEQFGLALPPTREAMWELMQTLDATTEEGAEHIAMLLGIADAADAYYRGLEQQERERAQALERQAQALADYTAQVQALRDELDAPLLSAFQTQWRDIQRWAAEATESLHETARAAGMQAAAEEDLALVHQVAAQRAAAAIRALRDAARTLGERLYGTELERIDAQIEAMGGVAQSHLDGIGAVGQAADDMYQRQLAAIQSIQQWLDDQLLGDLSTLTPQQRLEEARRQFEAASAAAAAGDVDALASLPELASQLLREGRDFWASGEEYTALEAMVRSVMQGFAGMDIGSAPGGGGFGGGGVGVSPELQALYEERDALLAQIEEDSRRAMAAEVAGYMREIMAATGESLAEVAASIRISVTDLVTDLGVIVGESTIENVMALTEVARMLGVDLATLATEVGIELGTLGDRQSLLNQALDQTLDGIPDEFRERLMGPLEALRSATTEADANAAIADLTAITDHLPAGIRDLLAPYFAFLDPAPLITELGTLVTIEDIVSQELAEIMDQTVLLESIDAALRAANSAAGLPGYETGTAYVPRTGPAVLHQGEMVLPAAIADIVRQAPAPSTSPQRGNAADVSELRALHRTLERVGRELAGLLARVAEEERRTGDRIEGRGRHERDRLLAMRG